MNHRFRRVLGAALAAVFLLAAVAFSLPQSSDDARRDAWQRPEEVMDALGVRPGSQVADVGCGDGYFVLHLARRVGAEGVVFGVDVNAESLDKLRRRAEDAKLTNVRIIRSREDDPLLPRDALDAVLIVNAYHEMREFDAMLRFIFAALKPGGRLVIIDAPGKNSDPRAEHQRLHTISESLVREDAQRNGLRFLDKLRDFDPNPEDRNSRGSWFFLLFEKSAH